jgi:hypothetical protein
MAKTKTKKIIQVPKQDRKSLRAKELNRLYSEGYRKKPDEPDWPEASVKLLTERLPKETW